MKNRIMRLFVISLVVSVVAACYLISADAASAKLYFSDPTVTVGNNVSIVVSIKGDDIAAYEMNISYDTSYLQFVSAKGNTGNFASSNSPGVVRVVDYLGSGSASSLSFTMTFKTLKTGTTKLTPSGYNFSSGSADNISPSAVGDSTVKIIPVPEASSDCTLKGLSIEGGSLSPAFNANTTEYTATVDFSVESLAVTALKNHSGASVYVSGNDALAVGENKITVTVTAENGDKKVYTITVTRGKNPLSTDIFVTVREGVTAEIAATISPDTVPKGFTLTKITVNEKEIDAILYDERALPAVLLLGNENVTQGFYYLNVGDMTVKTFDYLGNVESWLTIIDISLAEVPEGYEIGTYTFGETTRNVLVPSNVETPNHCLVYAIGASGEKSLYMYDPLENTYQRYSFAVLGEPETTVPEETEKAETEPKETQKENEKDNKKEDKSFFSNPIFKWSFIIIAALIVVLGVVGVVLAIKAKYQ